MEVESQAGLRPRGQSRPTAEPPSSRSSPRGLQTLGKLLAAEHPLRWVAAGDSLMRTGTKQRRGLASRVADVVRHEVGRPGDLIVDLTCSAQRIQHDFVERVLQSLAFEQANVLVLFCGNHDVLAGARGFMRFEQAVHRLFVEARDLDCHVVLNTPPCLQIPQSAEEVDCMLYREMLLSTAVEYEAVIVDHWSVWEWGLESAGSLADWLVDEAGSRTEAGLREICKLLSQELVAARDSVHTAAHSGV